MPSYKLRNKLLRQARLLPKPVRSLALRSLNPSRVARVKAARSLRWVTLFITNTCNARCDHCFYWSELNQKLPELSIDELDRTIRSIRTQLNTLRLSGGEPFLRRDLGEVVKIVDDSKAAQKISIPTHGMLDQVVPTVESMVESLRFTHLNVSVSLDGLEERHNASRKIKGGFDRAIANLRELVRLERDHPRFNVSTSVSLFREIALPKPGAAKSEAEQLIEFLKEDVGVRSVGYDHIRSAESDVFHLPAKINSSFAPPPKVTDDPGNRHKRDGDVQLDVDEMEQVNERLAAYEEGSAGRLNLRRLQLQTEIKKTRKRLVDCLAGYVDCVIYPSGEVAVCEFTKSFANLRDFDYDFEALWRSAEADRMRGLTRKCACTHPCHLSDSLAYDADFLDFYLDQRQSGDAVPAGTNTP